ncbi:MAG: translation initiation factor IF-3 [Candidatus Sungbacteria bacterium]|uniref:Translation initiation factor IF-3 n=1 Tax=Candidatus Sungiibacteriota bacterium TaxID=2750080 RepID=A0A931YCZ1_9BACT|nr:translation initiation factor IF-3 [Candidatus Sungbacteria bacterium]MBI2465618.1 translation initiation factor IF-3 [Candidatus Sungbacteria bacterium]
MRVNREIRAEKLVVIDETGKMLGVLSREEAFKTAQGKGLDLLEVNPNANPPVAKILDYGKFEYRQRKAEQKFKSTQKKQELKIVKIGLKTSAHDIEVKAGQADKFLQKGHKVKLEIFLRGREKAHRDLAKTRLVEFKKKIKEEHKADGNALSTPSGWSVVISK